MISSSSRFSAAQANASRKLSATPFLADFGAAPALEDALDQRVKPGEHDLADDRFFVGEVLVEGGLADVGTLGDVKGFRPGCSRAPR